MERLNKIVAELDELIRTGRALASADYSTRSKRTAPTREDYDDAWGNGTLAERLNLEWPVLLRGWRTSLRNFWSQWERTRIVIEDGLNDVESALDDTGTPPIQRASMRLLKALRGLKDGVTPTDSLAWRPLPEGWSARLEGLAGMADDLAAVSMSSGTRHKLSEEPQASLVGDAMLSAKDLAQRYEVPEEPLRKRLERRRGESDKGWREVTDRTKGDPRYLYSESFAMADINELRNKSSSAKRPAKK